MFSVIMDIQSWYYSLLRLNITISLVLDLTVLLTVFIRLTAIPITLDIYFVPEVIAMLATYFKPNA